MPWKSIGDRWSMYYDQCRRCGSKEKQYRSRGYCKSCDFIIRYNTDEIFRRKHIEAKRKSRLRLKEKREQEL